MTPLPEPPAEPLAVLPWLEQLPTLVILGIVLLLIALDLLQRLLSKRKRPVAAAPPPVPAVSPAGAPTADVGFRIGALEEQFLRTKAYREGCHALAEVVKNDLEQRTGLPVEEMTSSEIEQAFVRGVRVGDERDGALVGGPMLGRFMTGLAGRRFGREEPRRRHFVEACNQAREILT